MSSKPVSPQKLEELLENWARETLANIGIFHDLSSNYQTHRNAVINQLRSVYSDKAIMKFLDPADQRHIDSPDGFARITGPCGDTMEIYLKINGDMIEDASFDTDGCNPSVAAGGMMAEMARGTTLSSASAYSQQDVLDALGGLPEENRHCALLAVNTLKEAIESIPGHKFHG